MVRILLLPSLLLALVALASPVTCPAQSVDASDSKDSPGRSLTAEEIRKLRSGHALGAARVAERNGHPSPHHALELASDLKLTPDQIAAMRSVQQSLATKSRALGSELVEREMELDRLFADAVASEENVRSLVEEIARLQGGMRLAHLRAHVAARNILSADQIDAYYRLRNDWRESQETSTPTDRPGRR